MSDPTDVTVIDTEAIRRHRGLDNPAIRADNFSSPTARSAGQEEGEGDMVHVLSFISRNGMKIIVGVYPSHKLAEDAAEKFKEDFAESKVYRHDSDPEFRYQIEEKPVGQLAD